MKKLFTIVAISILVLTVSAFGVQALASEGESAKSEPVVAMTQEESLQKIETLLEENYADELKFMTEIVFDDLSVEQLGTMSDDQLRHADCKQSAWIVRKC